MSAIEVLTVNCPLCGRELSRAFAGLEPMVVRCECGHTDRVAFYRKQDPTLKPNTTQMTEDELRDELSISLVFYRRRLTQFLIGKMIMAAAERGHDLASSYVNPAATAEDLANAICERLAARETGDPQGYKR